MKNFKDYTQDIENIKKWYTSPLWWVIKYNEEDINENFFWNKKNINYEDINEFIRNIEFKLKKIKEQKKEIQNSDLIDIHKKFLLNNLNSTGLKYMMFKRSAYLEWEKAWLILNEEKRKELVRQVNKFQDIIYWPEVSENKEETHLVLSKLYKLLEKNAHILDDKEKETFENFLYKFDYSNKKKWDEISEISWEQQFLDTTKFRNLFEIVKDIYGLNDWSIAIENVGNFSVRMDSQQIVCPESKIEKTDIKSILQLIDHEISTHALRGDNTKKTIWTTWKWYLELEEWLATISGLMFDKKLDEIQIDVWASHIVSFISENASWEDAYNIIKTSLKLSNPKRDENILKQTTKNIFMRSKRFVSLYEKWANRKDLSYMRGRRLWLKLLKEKDNFIKDFYFSKLSWEDINLVDEFKKALDIDESQLKYPLWIWKILYKKLQWQEIFLEKLKEEDIRFEHIEKISYDTKRKIIEALNIVRK